MPKNPAGSEDLPATIRLRRKDTERLAFAVAQAILTIRAEQIGPETDAASAAEAADDAPVEISDTGLLVPAGAAPYTVLIDFANEAETVSGSSAYHVWAADIPSAVLTAQREIYQNLTTVLGVDGDDLDVFASAVFAGHIAPMWTPEPQEDTGDPDAHDPAFYDPARDPHYVITAVPRRKTGAGGGSGGEGKG